MQHYLYFYVLLQLFFNEFHFTLRFVRYLSRFQSSCEL